jgi:hypothetical protein
LLGSVLRVVVGTVGAAVGAVVVLDDPFDDPSNDDIPNLLPCVFQIRCPTGHAVRAVFHPLPHRPNERFPHEGDVVGLHDAVQLGMAPPDILQHPEQAQNSIQQIQQPHRMLHHTHFLQILHRQVRILSQTKEELRFRIGLKQTCVCVFFVVVVVVVVYSDTVCACAHVCRCSGVAGNRRKTKVNDGGRAKKVKTKKLMHVCEEI